MSAKYHIVGVIKNRRRTNAEKKNTKNVLKVYNQKNTVVEISAADQSALFWCESKQYKCQPNTFSLVIFGVCSYGVTKICYAKRQTDL